MMAVPTSRLDGIDWARRIKFLVDTGKLNAFDGYGNTPLIKVSNCYEASKLMIEAGADIYKRHKYHGSPLQKVGNSPNPNKRILSLYIEKVKKDYEYNKEKIANTLINGYWPLSSIIRLRDAEITKFALGAGHLKKSSHSSKEIKKIYHEALIIAVENVDVDNVKILVEYDADLCSPNWDKITALSYVYKSDLDNPTYAPRRLEILRILLDRINSTNKSLNNQDIENLVESANKEGIEMLISSGVDLQIEYSSKGSILHAIAVNENLNVIEMLFDNTVNVDIRDDRGLTPLMNAAKSGNAVAVEFLLNKGADVTAEIKSLTYILPLTALYFAVIEYTESERHYKETIQILLERGSNAQFVIPVGNNQVETIFDVTMDSTISSTNNVSTIMIVMEHLAMKKLNGSSITKLIFSKINSHNQYKEYFEVCEKQLKVKIYKSITLLDLLTMNEITLERYVRIQDIVLEFEIFLSNMSNFYFFSTSLQRRLLKASQMVRFRREVAYIFGRIMKMNYERFPLIVDNIVSYLDRQSMTSFMNAFDSSLKD